MDLLALISLAESQPNENGLAAGLLESLEHMVARRHRPAAWLLVRLTDGRVKLVATPAGGRQARDEATRIRNEYGPFRVAFSLEVEDRPGGILLAVESLAGPGAARLERLCRDPLTSQ